MFVSLENTPRDYAWGSRGAISALLGAAPTDALEAELWMGAHPGNPARITAPTTIGAFGTLDRWIAADPHAAGLTDARLPFLFKVLAAAEPLSIQAHPDAAQARAGFERENAAGIALDDPRRNYKDPYPKPELVVALEDGFEALSGFRELEEVRADLRELMAAMPVAPELTALSARTRDTDFAASEVSAALAGRRAGLVAELLAAAEAAPELRVSDTLLRIGRRYPGDPGILVALLLHRVTLNRGEALFLDAGNVHAYLEGISLELMTASDNVLRGGTTQKHVDIPELLSVVRFGAGPVPYLPAVAVDPGITVYRPEGVDFMLYRVQAAHASTLLLPGPAIALGISGSSRLTAAGEESVMTQGDIRYVPARDPRVDFSGDGEVWIASSVVI